MPGGCVFFVAVTAEGGSPSSFFSFSLLEAGAAALAPPFPKLNPPDGSAKVGGGFTPVPAPVAAAKLKAAVALALGLIVVDGSAPPKEKPPFGMANVGGPGLLLPAEVTPLLLLFVAGGSTFLLLLSSTCLVVAAGGPTVAVPAATGVLPNVNPPGPDANVEGLNAVPAPAVAAKLKAVALGLGLMVEGGGATPKEKPPFGAPDVAASPLPPVMAETLSCAFATGESLFSLSVDDEEVLAAGAGAVAGEPKLNTVGVADVVLVAAAPKVNPLAFALAFLPAVAGAVTAVWPKRNDAGNVVAGVAEGAGAAVGAPVVGVAGLLEKMKGLVLVFAGAALEAPVVAAEVPNFGAIRGVAGAGGAVSRSFL